MLKVCKSKLLNQGLFKKRMDDLLSNDYGGYTLDLEKLAAEYVGTRYCISMTNPSICMDACLAWLKTKIPFGKVAVPSFVPTGSINSIVRAGFEPLFIDIDEDYCISMDHLETVVSSDLAAIMPFNILGNIYDYQYLAKFRDLPVIVNSTEALGCQVIEGESVKMAGSFGDCEILSISTGFTECGLVATSNEEIYNFLTKFKFGGLDLKTNTPEILGIKANLDEMTGAAALCQLEDIEQINSLNFDNFIYYKNNLPEWCKLSIPNVFFSNFSYIACRVNKYFRDDFRKYLFGQKIQTRIINPAHYAPLYMKGHLELVNTSRISEEMVILPSGIEMNFQSIGYIIRAIEGFNHG
jgi:dTDP-4-amino-4,6-dideoxygalactose transaminase